MATGSNYGKEAGSSHVLAKSNAHCYHWIDVAKVEASLAYTVGGTSYHWDIEH